ncbi:MAG: hypothetical protein KC503_32925 [Myxococcales bacterium]|nr:hypothetical protein [Myxococcales bacterium]
MRTSSSVFVALLALVAVASAACDSSRTTGDGGGSADGSVADGRSEGVGTDGPGGLEAGSDGPLPATTTCDPAKATCRALPQACGRGEVRSVSSAGCWGACVPIATCTDVPERPDCDMTKVSCERVSPTCPDGYTPTHVNACYGPCVPNVVCACEPNGPSSQCPSETPACFNLDKRCGPLD